jgi:hypothetical protein
MKETAIDVAITLGKTGVCLGLLFFCVHSCFDSNWYKESERARAAGRLAAATPHVIRETDGCKVYAFERDNTDHYFTRCGDTVTTERNYTQSCGKGCVKHKQETIVTEGNK